MADGTVDNLNIQISVDSQKAERSLDNLAKTMDRVRKSFSAIDTTQFKNLCASSGEFVKSLNKIKTSTKGIGDFKVRFDAEQIDAGIEELRHRFRDAGIDFEFTGTTTELDSEIKKTTAQLNRLFEKEDKLRAIGANINTQGFRSLEFDIASLTNKLDILREKSEALKKIYAQNLAGLSIERGDTAPEASKIPDRSAEVSADSMKYNSSAMEACASSALDI